MQKKTSLAVVALVVAICTCCAVYVPTKTGRIKSIVESYFKGNGQEMFFVKPIVLESKNNRLTTDFTLLIPDSSNLVRSNISVFSKDGIKSIDSIRIGEGKAYRDLTFMFKDHSKKTKQIRYTLQFPISAFKDQLDRSELRITTFSNGNSETFETPRKWQKIRKRIKEVVFGVE